MPKGLERVKNDVELPHALRLEGAIASSGQRDQRELADFYLERGRRLYEQENDSEALADLNRALYLSPYQAEAHLLIGRIHLRSGRVHEAIDAFKISLWSAETPKRMLPSRRPISTPRISRRRAAKPSAPSSSTPRLSRPGASWKR